MNDEELYLLAADLGRRLEAARLVVTTVESCTGGWIAKCLTDVPGSSVWFERGLVTYGDAAKSGLVDVPARLLETQGAVSAGVVSAMAEGALRRSGADLSVAVSGVAGPGGGSRNKPVGTVWLAWARRDGERIQCDASVEHFSGGRETVRRQAVAAALEGLLAMLVNSRK